MNNSDRSEIINIGYIEKTFLSCLAMGVPSYLFNTSPSEGFYSLLATSLMLNATGYSYARCNNATKSGVFGMCLLSSVACIAMYYMSGNNDNMPPMPILMGIAVSNGYCLGNYCSVLQLFDKTTSQRHF